MLDAVDEAVEAVCEVVVEAFFVVLEEEVEADDLDSPASFRVKQVALCTSPKLKKSVYASVTRGFSRA